jgi:nucleoid-associated protein YgaU
MASRYDDSITFKTEQGKPYYESKRYPVIPLSESDIYVVTIEGDRLDLIAYQYYRDTNLWWVIAFVNSNVTRGSMFPAPGTQLRIPTDLSNVMRLYKQFNQVR